ncbi:MAG TPA: S8 family peptidase, partial [Paracoccaceae bacterium]|nr:S8 family peptidase [Paracoccaceae bacterium]
ADGDTNEPYFARFYCVTSFDMVAVQAARDAAEFAIQSFNSSFSFRAVRAEFAHAVGLSGAGELIAVIDNGFVLNSPELAEKSITTYGDPTPINTDGETGHGTRVASVAAGSKDDSGMMGVAYNADLHVSSYHSGNASIAAATLDALADGAIVQNNSWGLCAGFEPDDNSCIQIDIQDIVSAGNEAAREQAFANAVGPGGGSYLDALRAFTREGIVVFANSNGEADTVLGILGALPLAFPELLQGWLLVVNGSPTFNGSGDIVSAQRVSASCMEMAHSCITAEGVITMDRTTIHIGTSFAAPIVSAGVAILAEAFPSLSAADIRNRLLYTADNSFYRAFDGYTDFGNGLTHGYNDDFGHGFMDLEAALLPIGTISVPLGATVTAEKQTLEDSIVVAGTAYGGTLKNALSSKDMMLVDSLGGNFNVNAAMFLEAPEFQENRVGLFFDEGA